MRSQPGSSAPPAPPSTHPRRKETETSVLQAVPRESKEQARKYDDVAKRLFKLVVELSDGADLGPGAQNSHLTEEISRIGISLDEEGGLALMQVVGGRVTERGHAAAAKARRDTAAFTYESHQGMANLASAGRTLDEEWKGIGQWR